jgi:geranylgeranylglycerol-phosphate geranylgeranyltransferase
MFKRLLVFIEISRPHNMMVAAFGAVAGYVVSGGRSVAEVWVAALFTALVTGAGNVINDLYDAEIDRVNKPQRPLPSGRMSRRQAAALYVTASALVTLGAFVFLPLRLTALMVTWEAALYVYARWGKRVFVVNNLMVASVASSAFVAGGLVTGNVAAVLLPIGIAFVFVVCRELVKGAEDVVGDRAARVNTAAVVVGVGRTVLWASVLMLVLASAVPLPALTGYYGVFYLWVMELSVVPGLLAATYMILERPQKRTFGRVSMILKVAMFFGVVAMGVGDF